MINKDNDVTKVVGKTMAKGLKIKIMTGVVCAAIIGGTVGCGKAEALSIQQEQVQQESLVSKEENEVVVEQESTQETMENKMSGLELLADILLYPEEHKEYYVSDADLDNLSFCLIDYDGDKDLDLVLADGVFFGESEPSRIINFLEVTDYSVDDLDGNNTYPKLEFFQLYKNHVLKTELNNPSATVNIWKIGTDDAWEGALYAVDANAYDIFDAEARHDAMGYKFLTDQNGVEKNHEEADKLYDSLCGGEIIPLNWMKVTRENVEQFIYKKELVDTSEYKEEGTTELSTYFNKDLEFRGGDLAHSLSLALYDGAYLCDEMPYDETGMVYKYRLGEKEDVTIMSTSYEDDLSYVIEYGKKIDSLRVYGINIGMDAKEALDILKSQGFYKLEDYMEINIMTNDKVSIYISNVGTVDDLTIVVGGAEY